MRQPGIEPGSIAWKATMLTFTPPTLYEIIAKFKTKVWKPSNQDRTAQFESELFYRMLGVGTKHFTLERGSKLKQDQCRLDPTDQAWLNAMLLYLEELANIVSAFLSCRSGYVQLKKSLLFKQPVGSLLFNFQQLITLQIPTHSLVCKMQLTARTGKSVHWRGIEPRSPAWQARILPLNHQCLGGKVDKLKKIYQTSHL